MPNSNKKNKLIKEQEEIKRLRSLSNILNMGDIENAVLANTSKESEPVSDDIIDELLNHAAAGETPEEQKNLEALGRLTTGGTLAMPKSAKAARLKSKPKKSPAHSDKEAKAPAQRPRAAHGKKKRSNKR